MTEYLVFVRKGVDCCGSRASRHSRARTHGSELATLGNLRSHSVHSNCLISSNTIFAFRIQTYLKYFCTALKVFVTKFGGEQRFPDAYLKLIIEFIRLVKNTHVS